MPRLSIIIPCFAAIEPLETTLASVLQNRPDDAEILVAHAGVYSDPYDLRGEVRFIETDSEAFPAELMGAACSAARGSVLHLLEPGVEVAEGWTEPALAHFNDPNVAAVAPLVFDAAARDQLVSAGIAYGPGGGRWIRRQAPIALGSKNHVLGPTLSAAFYRRSMLNSVGGIDPSVGFAMADVELALSLKARGYEAVLEPESRVYSTRGLGSGETAFQQGWCAERVFWRHASEVGWLPSLVMHPVLVASEFAAGLARGGALTRLLGRAVACLDSTESSPASDETPPPAAEATAPDNPRRASIRIDRAHTSGKRPAQPAQPAAKRERAAQAGVAIDFRGP